MSSEPGRSTSVDFSRVPRSAWISGGGALVLLISVFLSWYSVKINIPGLANTSTNVSGWDATDVSRLVALLALVALAAWVLELFVPTVQLPFPAWMIAGACGGLSVLLVLFRIISKPTSGADVTVLNALGVSVSLAFGIFVSLLAAIAVTAGAYMRMSES
jgi:multisubunit Na+/H+ antiporter MnhF subunit